MTHIPRMAIAALLAMATLSVPTSAADGDTMRIRRATLVERTRRSGEPFHVLSLSGRFVPFETLRAFDPASDAIVVSVGGQEVLRASRADPDGHFMGRRIGVWTFRSRDPEDRVVRSSLLLDLRRGAFRARVGGADLGNLVEQGLDDVVVMLDVGGVALHATLDFSGGRRRLDFSGGRRRMWRFRSRAPIPSAPGGGSGGNAGGGTGGGGGGGGTIPPGPVTFRGLGGEFYGGTTAAGLSVARSQAQFTSMWAGRTQIPLPTVDFSREMVVFVDMGTRATGGYVLTVTGVRSSAAGLMVSHTETSPGANCFVTTAISRVWQAVAVPITNAQVSGNRSTTIRTCP